jgi:hypothetical protein
MKTFIVYNLDTGLPIAIGQAMKHSRRKSNRRGTQLGKGARTSVKPVCSSGCTHFACVRIASIFGVATAVSNQTRGAVETAYHLVSY